MLRFAKLSVDPIVWKIIGAVAWALMFQGLRVSLNFLVFESPLLFCFERWFGVFPFSEQKRKVGRNFVLHVPCLGIWVSEHGVGVFENGLPDKPSILKMPLAGSDRQSRQEPCPRQTSLERLAGRDGWAGCLHGIGEAPRVWKGPKDREDVGFVGRKRTWFPLKRTVCTTLARGRGVFSL